MTNKSKNIARLLSLLFLIFPVCNTWGQEINESSWQLKGFVDTYHAIRSVKPNDFMSSRTRFRGEIIKSFEASALFVSFNATYNALLKERTGFELREAYLDHQEQYWGFRVGRQLVIWGVADGVRITDLVSPMDMTEFLAQDYDDIRMPVNALRFFIFYKKMKIELIAVPSFEGYRLATDTRNPWNVIPKIKYQTIVWKEEGSHPNLCLKNIEYGSRLSFALPGADFSFAALYTWNKMPVIKFRPTVEGIEVSPQYYRMWLFGGDVSKPFGQFVLRGEVAFNVNKHFSYKPEASNMEQLGFNSVNYLLGVDWYAPREWTVMVQISSESIIRYKSQIAQPQHNSLLTFNISKKLLDNTLQLSNFTYVDLNHLGWFSRFSFSYELNDHIRLSAGYDWIRGSDGIFGTYKKNSEIWATARYSF